MKSAILITALFSVFSLTAHAEWKTDTEVGVVQQSGNTNQENTYAKTKWDKKSGKNMYTLEGQYINSSGEAAGTGGDVRLAESASAGLKYTRDVSKKLGIYGGALWEKNRFAGYDERTAGELGLKYTVLKTDDRYFNTELGYRYRNQYEYLLGSGKGPKTESNFGRLYLEYGSNLTKTSVYKIWVETLYDFSDSENIEVNFEPSIDVAIGEFFSASKPARVSIKLAYKGMYDNVPAATGLKRYDSIFTTSLKVLY